MDKYIFNKNNLTFEKVTKKHTIQNIFKKIPYFLILIVSLMLISTITNDKNDELIKNYNELIQKIDNVERELDYLKNKDNSVYRKILGINNTKYETVSKSTSYNNVEDVFQKIKDLENSYSQIDKSYEEVIRLLEEKKDFIHKIPTIKPVSDFDLICVSSEFGKRIHPIYKTLIFHSGIDFDIKRGTKIFATADGIVSNVDLNYYGYGNKIIIDHENGYKTLYAHLDNNIKVSVGDIVKKGQIIAHSGNTGTSTGPHLHYEIELNGKVVNPSFYILNESVK